MGNVTLKDYRLAYLEKEFLGRSTQSLMEELEGHNNRLDDLLDSDEELGGGSPLESTYERIDDLEDEIERRESLLHETCNRL